MPEVTWASIASRGVPDDLKPIQGQLQRAREVAPHEPEIAYWLLFSAAQDGLKLHPASPESSVFLAELVGSLESAKQSEQIARSPLITDDRLAREHARKFALGVFVRADNQDRAGQADRCVEFPTTFSLLTHTLNFALRQRSLARRYICCGC